MVSYLNGGRARRPGWERLLPHVILWALIAGLCAAWFAAIVLGIWLWRFV